VGGAAYFWVGYVVFALAYSGLHAPWLPAKMAADVVGWSINYLIQRYWAFDSVSLRRHNGRVLGRYGLVTAANLVLDYLIIAGLKHAGVSPYVGFFISSGFFTFWNYAWYRFWVFMGQPTTKGEKA